MNNIHHILTIYNLEIYSGPGPFVPEGDIGGNTLGNPLGGGEELIDEDDEVEDEILQLEHFLENLTI